MAGTAAAGEGAGLLSGLREARRQRGWTQLQMIVALQEAARRQGIVIPDDRESVRVRVSSWENGRSQPMEPYLGLLADVLGVSEAALSPAAVTTGVDPGRLTPGAGAEVLRRGLVDVISERSLTTASLDDWEYTVLRHGQATRSRPAGLMLADLTADLEDLQQALAGCRSPSALRRLTRVTAYMAGLMCLTLIKLNDRAAFRRWARAARIAAEEAGDPLASSWVRAHEAYGYYYCGEPVEAISVAQHAQALAGSVPCVGAALAAALEGRGHAALGPTRAQEARAAMCRAEEVLSSLDADSVSASALGYSEAQLRFHYGSVLTHLHDTEGAWREQERALRLYPASDFLDRTLTSLDRAHCLAHDGEIGEAMSYAAGTLAGLDGQQRDGMITNRARQILAALPPRQRALPPAREFRELLQHPSGELER
jgi:transcriptional regulator with XRE-family HTH domain